MARIAVFTKYPERGKVKTRLAKDIGQDKAAQLQKEMTEFTLFNLWPLIFRGHRLEIRFDGATLDQMISWLGDGLEYEQQGDGELGIRMARAIADGLKKDNEPVIVVGSDCPGINAEIVLEAIEACKHSDIVIGPAYDGGYYLIGMKNFVPDLFEHILWGSSAVFEETVRKAKKLGLSVCSLILLKDVDRFEDIEIFYDAKRKIDWKGLPFISVIIPTLNEERNIAKALENARGVKIERIVADGGSNDRTRDIVKEYNVKLIYSNKGRAIQQNAGAQCAKGEILLFLHADSSLPRGFDSAIRQAYVNNFSFGAFSLGIDAGGLGFRATEIIANARSKYLGLPYGDQAIFVDKKLFEDVGGFPIIPIMEDFLLIKNLTKITGTKPKILSQKVMTSPRRWQQHGLCRVFFINQLVILGYYAGVSPDELANFYKIPSMQMGKTILFKTFKKLLSINGNA